MSDRDRDPLLVLARRFEEFEAPFRRISEALNAFRLPPPVRFPSLEPVERLMRLNQEMQRSLGFVDVQGALGVTSRAVAEIQETVRHFNEVAQRLTGETHRSFQLLTAIPDFGLMRAPSAATLRSLRLATEVGPTDPPLPSRETVELVALINQLVQDAIARAPSTPAMRVPWFRDFRLLLELAAFLLAVLGFLRPLPDADLRAELATLSEHVAEVRSILSETDREEGDPPYDYYAVDRRAPLKQLPKPSATVLRWMEAGELLWVRERRGEWLRIVVGDATGAEFEGWVRKKYLTRE